MKNTVLILIVIFSFLSCQKKENINYFNQQPPKNTPIVFAPNIISLKNRWEGNMSFSSDGKTAFFNVFVDSTKTIYTSNFKNNKWSSPKPFTYIGKENNWEPFISNNGKEFYFVSSRHPGKPEWNGRIWKSTKTKNNSWSKPKLIDFNLTTDNGFWFPNTSKKENLFFGGNFKSVGNLGKGDLYYHNKKENKTYNITSLNTKHEEWDPLISPDESFILWCSDREGGFGGTDIYVSFKKENGKWGKQ